MPPYIPHGFMGGVRLGIGRAGAVVILNAAWRFRHSDPGSAKSISELSPVHGPGSVAFVLIAMFRISSADCVVSFRAACWSRVSSTPLSRRSLIC